jgi:hypothetical protein
MITKATIKEMLRIMILENEGDRDDICNDVFEFVMPLIEGLEQIAEPSGAYSRDPLQHANNTIDNCSNIASGLLIDIENKLP